MQFQVPQFIETEDKIIGPLTLKQFFFIAIPSLVSFLFYNILETWLFLSLSIPFMSIGLSFAFLKINSRPAFDVFKNAMSFYWNPQTYVWKPENPTLPKTTENLRQTIEDGFSLENIVRGLAIKNAWRYIQTGSKPAPETPPELVSMPEPKIRFQVFRGMSGERRAAKRVDYR